MEPSRSAGLGVLIVLLQVIYGLAEPPPCSNGFDPEVFVFRVHTHDLHKGTKLGRVSFIDCNGGTFHIYESSDKRFPVDANGTVILQTQVTLPEDQVFSIYTWDSDGNKHTASVRVEHEGRTSHYNGQQEDTEALSPSQSKTALQLPLLEPPRFSKGLRRRKRDWVIPPMSISENDRGPFPKQVVQIKSSYASLNTMMYSVTGEGADQPPKGLFTMNKNTGWLYVTRPLDREEKDNYTLQAQAIAGNGKNEAPADITINVIDQNDNSPVFTQNPFLGSVPEASKIGFEVMKVTATDADDPTTANAIIGYSIISQTPALPSPKIFSIDLETGGIQVISDGLDREKYPEYTLLIQAADMEGKGLTTTGTAVITVTDSNDNAPQFVKSLYTVSVPENKVGAVVVKLPVTDGDDPQSPAWMAKFRIINGNNAGSFNITTGPTQQEGIITTVKPLDFELVSRYTLLIVAENDVPFAKPLPTSTATVTVNVQDMNEAPVFDPVQNIISKPENLEVGSEVTVYTATDPDTAKNQRVIYRIGSDPAGWLSVDGGTGLIKVKSLMDRESPYVNDGKYKALILAIDDDPVPATGTGTLVIELQDVNDNTPIIEERKISVCNKDSAPVLLSVTDKDGPGFAAPFSVELQRDSGKNWTARMNSSKTEIILALKTALEPGEYNVVLRVYDAELHFQDNTVQASVCECTGQDFQCTDRAVAGFGLFPIIGILGAILVLLMLVLLLLLFLKRKKSGKEGPLIPTDDVRDNLYCYDEEGGGEEDQDYDLSVLHRGLDNRPGVFRNDEAPTFMSAPQYRPRPTNPEEIGAFLCDNLKAADNDPTAPPYDSLLVFDYEGGGSAAGSVSSLNSSSSGDEDYDCLHEWGPRFKKLADMFGGED